MPVSESKTIPGKTYGKMSYLLCALALLVLAGCQGIVAGTPQIPLPPPNPNATLDNSVNHIIFMMQENRSFDAYFGKINDFRSGTFALGRDMDDLESSFTNPADDGTLIGNFHLPTGCIFNTTAAWLEAWGDMNRFAAPPDLCCLMVLSILPAFMRSQTAILTAGVCAPWASTTAAT